MGYIKISGEKMQVYVQTDSSTNSKGIANNIQI